MKKKKCNERKLEKIEFSGDAHPGGGAEGYKGPRTIKNFPTKVPSKAPPSPKMPPPKNSFAQRESP